jgi:HK97 family phage major capsid protein
MLGLLNSNVVTANAVAGQQGATIVAANVVTMKAALLADSHRFAVAPMHPDAYAQVALLGPQFFSPGDAVSPMGRLLGAPIIVTESCEALGQRGDIWFADFSRYLLLLKEPRLATSTSLDVWFDRDLAALKFRMRADGMPLLAAPVASRVGGGMRSAFVTLAARP